MGDRTWACVEIRDEYYPILVKAMNDKGEDLDTLVNEVEYFGDTCQLVRYEANYGNMEDITDYLDALVIDYNHSWENGSEYSSGTRYVRFDDLGLRLENEIYDNADGLIYINQVMEKIKTMTSVEEVKEYLEEAAKEFEVLGGRDITQIPIRPLTEEEAAIIMQFKIEKENENER